MGAMLRGEDLEPAEGAQMVRIAALRSNVRGSEHFQIRKCPSLDYMVETMNRLEIFLAASAQVRANTREVQTVLYSHVLIERLDRLMLTRNETFSHSFSNLKEIQNLTSPIKNQRLADLEEQAVARKKMLAENLLVSYDTPAVTLQDRARRAGGVEHLALPSCLYEEALILASLSMQLKERGRYLLEQDVEREVIRRTYRYVNNIRPIYSHTGRRPVQPLPNMPQEVFEATQLGKEGAGKW